MTEYHKIQTVYKRDPGTKHKTLLEGEYSLPEFGYLADNEWVFTEKVDGTNIRVMYRPGALVFGGKTARAQIPAPLVNTLNILFNASRLASVFPDGEVCLYGEGYGAGIQKGGWNYRPDPGFVLFDVRVCDWWLKREDMEDIAGRLDIACVPIIGRGTLTEMVGVAKVGFTSTWGDFPAEGIVARPAVELFARNGSRIITKIKHRDFVPA